MKLTIISSRTCPQVDIESHRDTFKILQFLGCTIVAYIYDRELAKQKGLKLIKYYPNYNKYGKVAPMERNKLIVDECDCVLAFWDGTSRGTKFALDYAKEKNKPIKILQK